MTVLEMPEETQKKLELGDYITVHLSDLKTAPLHNAEPCDMQLYREELFKRIRKQRGDLLETRCRGAA